MTNEKYPTIKCPWCRKEVTAYDVYIKGEKEHKTRYVYNCQCGLKFVTQCGMLIYFYNREMAQRHARFHN